MSQKKTTETCNNRIQLRKVFSKWEGEKKDIPDVTKGSVSPHVE